MKLLKCILLLLFLGSSITPLFSVTYNSEAPRTSLIYEHDAQNVALGSTSTALVSIAQEMSSNPASLGTLQDSQSGFAFGYGDMIPGSEKNLISLDDFLTSPIMDTKLYYTAPGWGISLVNSYRISDIILLEDTLNFNIEKTNTFSLGFATGFGPLQIGTHLHAVKVSSKTSASIATNHADGGLAADVLQNVFLTTYDSRDTNSEEVSLSLGVLFQTETFSLGLYSPEFIDVVALSNSESFIDLDTVLNELEIGCSLYSNPYNMWGDRNLFSLLGAVDIKKIGDAENREYSIGLQTGLFLSERMEMNLSLGYREPLPDFTQIVFGPQFSKGVFSAGLGITLFIVSLDIAFEMTGSDLACITHDYNISEATEGIMGKCTLSLIL